MWQTYIICIYIQFAVIRKPIPECTILSDLAGCTVSDRDKTKLVYVECTQHAVYTLALYPLRVCERVCVRETKNASGILKHPGCSSYTSFGLSAVAERVGSVPQRFSFWTGFPL